MSRLSLCVMWAVIGFCVLAATGDDAAVSWEFVSVGARGAKVRYDKAMESAAHDFEVRKEEARQALMRDLDKAT